jgi:ribosomal protein S18 acetylase RimI-like enzyme
MCAIDTATLSDAIKRKDNLPRYPMPAALIGRLATDERVRGRGYGERLLGEAIDVILAISESIGCFGVITDAKNEGAVGFYEKYGFELLPVVAEFPKRMFIALETVRAARGVIADSNTDK